MEGGWSLIPLGRRSLRATTEKATSHPQETLLDNLNGWAGTGPLFANVIQSVRHQVTEQD